MENKIILVTNRGVRSKRNGATLFKNKITKSSHRLRCAEVNLGSKENKYRLSLVSEGNEQEFITNSVALGNDKPWVFFVHGNNQTLDKNLEKCFKLRELYDVNVLAFSWPSVHHGKIRGFLNYFPRQPNIGMTLIRLSKSKIKQYKKAKINAKLSAPDFVDSIAMAKVAFENSSRKVNFVSHSLGSYVVENSHSYKPLIETMSLFDNILFHQGDVDNKDHRLWVDAIEKNNSVVITTNEEDDILAISSAYHMNKRLGNVSKVMESGSPIYRDFTGIKNIGLTGHTIFLTPSNKNSDVFSFFKPIIGE